MSDSDSTPTRILAPSLLAGNHANLSDALSRVELAKIQWLHLDIMDGHFVPNLSFGPQTVADARKIAPDLFFDTHLMLDRPDLMIDAFANAGSELITIHVEPFYPIRKTLQAIREKGLKAGLALNPGTPFERAVPFLSEIDLLLLMTVQPGFGGQAFRTDVLEKIQQAAQTRKSGGYSFRIEVDGGVDSETGLQCAKAGADTFVCGTAFFKADDPVGFRKILEGT
ncbi:MAG: ribulose-phosphate 3-epimerase [Verrucomicrobiota bacterium]